jgi:translation initiation factor IF-2
MSETREPEDKARGRKTMSLGVKKTVESGHVRQSFSHGRSKSVLVEKKRSKKPLTMQEAVANVPQEGSTPQPQRPKPQGGGGGGRDQQRARQPDTSQQDRARNVLRQLSNSEMDARARALTAARQREEVERVERAEEEERAAKEAVVRAEEARIRAVEDS